MKPRVTPRVAWILTALTMSLLLFSPPPAHAQQVSGTVSVDIDFPPLLILYYYSDLSVDIPAAALASVVGAGALDENGASAVVDATFTGTAGMLEATVTPLGLDPSNVQMTLQNTWAVRSVGDGSGDTQVSATVGPETTLTGTNGGTIVISSASNTPTTFAPTGLGGFQLGTLVLGLDLRNASQAGNYSNAAGTQLTITAEHL